MNHLISAVQIRGNVLNVTVSYTYDYAPTITEALEKTTEINAKLSDDTTTKSTNQPNRKDKSATHDTKTPTPIEPSKSPKLAQNTTQSYSSLTANLNPETLAERLCVAAATSTTIEELIEVMEIYKEELDRVHHKTRGKFVRDACQSVADRGRIKMTAEEIGLALEQTSGKRLVEEDKNNRASFKEVTRTDVTSAQAPTPPPVEALIASVVPASPTVATDTPIAPVEAPTEASEGPSVDAALVALERHPIDPASASNKARLYAWFFQNVANVYGKPQISRSFVDGVLAGMQTGPGVLATAEGRSAMLQAMTGPMRVFYENTTKCQVVA